MKISIQTETRIYHFEKDVPETEIKGHIKKYMKDKPFKYLT